MPYILDSILDPLLLHYLNLTTLLTINMQKITSLLRQYS